MDGLFADIYPEAAGHKARETSRQAAEAITPSAKPLRQRILEELTHYPGSPEQLAKRLGVPLMNARPRFSELAAKNLIRDSGRRARAQGGRLAIIWEVVRAGDQAASPSERAAAPEGSAP